MLKYISFGQIDHKEVLKKVRENGYCLIYVNELEDERRLAANEYRQLIGQIKVPHPPLAQFERFNGTDCFWKAAIRSTNGVGASIPQVMTYLYLNKKSVGIESLLRIGKLTTILRNRVSGLPDSFGEQGYNSSWWNATRIHHYPSGGGFMAEHIDTYYPDVLSKSELPFIQASFLLSTRGDGFSTGGGYVISRNGEKKYLESAICPAHYAIWDGSCPHGIEDVDLDRLLDLSACSGRISLLSPLQPLRR